MCSRFSKTKPAQAVCAPVPSIANNILQLTEIPWVAERHFEECGDGTIAGREARFSSQLSAVMSPQKPKETPEGVPGRDEFVSSLTKFAEDRG